MIQEMTDKRGFSIIDLELEHSSEKSSQSYCPSSTLLSGIICPPSLHLK
jgi:hypothetical protein